MALVAAVDGAAVDGAAGDLAPHPIRLVPSATLHRYSTAWMIIVSWARLHLLHTPCCLVLLALPLPWYPTIFSHV